jgi:hypothetical protein
MLGAPLKDFPDLRKPELQAGGPEEVAPSATRRWVWSPAFRAWVRDRLYRLRPFTCRQSTDADATHVFAITGQKQ